MAQITINLDKLLKLGLTIDQYTYLYALYCKARKADKDYLKAYGPIRYREDMLEVLQNKKFIKQRWDNNDFSTSPNIDLRESAISLFEEGKDLFFKFFNYFPLKTPSGRYLRPSDPDTIKGRKIRKKWDKLFSKNVSEAEKAIQVLLAQMEDFKRNNRLEYFHNMETWLNQGDYEIYRDLIDTKKKIDKRMKEDFA